MSLLLKIAILLVVVAIPLLVYIMFKQGVSKVTHVWMLAIRGHNLSRLYVALIFGALILAFVAVLNGKGTDAGPRTTGEARPQLSRFQVG